MKRFAWVPFAILWLTCDLSNAASFLMLGTIAYLGLSAR